MDAFEIISNIEQTSLSASQDAQEKIAQGTQIIEKAVNEYLIYAKNIFFAVYPELLGFSWEQSFTGHVFCHPHEIKINGDSYFDYQDCVNQAKYDLDRGKLRYPLFEEELLEDAAADLEACSNFRLAANDISSVLKEIGDVALLVAFGKGVTVTVDHSGILANKRQEFYDG